MQSIEMFNCGSLNKNTTSLIREDYCHKTCELICTFMSKIVQRVYVDPLQKSKIYRRIHLVNLKWNKEQIMMELADSIAKR